MKIISIVGARPQFIKLAPLCAELKKHADIQHIVINSGQHYDYEMSKQFFNELDIDTPKYNLEVGSGSQLFQIGNILLKLDDVFDAENPDMILVFGDTNTTSASAIAAAKKNIPLAHVEAGLREFNKQVPEEINKLITDAVTDLYFAPTETGMQNLQNMGVKKNAYNVGDIGIDLLVNCAPNIEQIESATLHKYNIQKKEYVFMTCHRAANTDIKENLIEILTAVKNIEHPVLFPIHPRTKQSCIRFKIDLSEIKNLIVIDPIGFFETQALIKNAIFCLTDSGGVIKETYFNKVPGIIIDTQTEWVETVKEGWNQLVGPIATDITKAISNAQTLMTHHSNAVGNGTASAQIVKHIKQYLYNGK
jgi:UDP-N-acetylglucosamine 2-epimerase